MALPFAYALACDCQVATLEATWAQRMSSVERKCSKTESRISRAERSVTPAAVAAQALATQTKVSHPPPPNCSLLLLTSDCVAELQEAEERASHAQQARAAMSADLESMREELARHKRLLASSEQRLREAEAANTTLAANNKVLIMELDEKRSLAEAARRAQLAAQKQKATLLAAQSQLKKEMLSRDSVLKQVRARAPQPQLCPVNALHLPH